MPTETFGTNFGNNFDLGRSSNMPISLNLADSNKQNSMAATPHFKDSDSASDSNGTATIEKAIE
jgi:hypothetical protein